PGRHPQRRRQLGGPRSRRGRQLGDEPPARRLAGLQSGYAKPVLPQPRRQPHLMENAPMKETVGFIGLGGMGLAMATNLLKAGFGLRVYNRTAEKARPLLELGAQLARSPAEAVSPGGMVVTMVSDDRAVEEVTLGANGLLPRLG